MTAAVLAAAILAAALIMALVLQAIEREEFAAERRAWDEERRRYIAAVLVTEHGRQAPAAVLRPQAPEEPREFIVPEGL